MLARSADNLFWVARYIERADFSARMIDAALRLAALPKAYGGDGTEWVSPLAAAGTLDAVKKLYDTPDQDNVFAFLAFERDNPTSIRNCIEGARNAARAVRTALTVEMWESINAAWLELRRMESVRIPSKPMPREDIDRFLDFVKTISREFDGAAYRTMLRNEAYWFNRLGSYRTRRQYRAHSRCEISCSSARDGTGWRHARLFSMDGDLARGVRVDGLSLGLSRKHKTLACDGPPCGMPADAALAGIVL
jgi:uncharacterized alpha-E superfamily protein